MNETEPTPLLFPDTETTTAYLMRVKPGHRSLLDPITHDPVWEELHNIETCFGDDPWIPMTRVRQAVAELVGEGQPRGVRELLADVNTHFVLGHPHTPYGLAIKFTGGVPWTVVYFRGGTYERQAGGSLTRMTGQGYHGLWPKPDRWRVAKFYARLLFRRKGLLS